MQSFTFNVASALVLLCTILSRVNAVYDQVPGKNAHWRFPRHVMCDKVTGSTTWNTIDLELADLQSIVEGHLTRKKTRYTGKKSFEGIEVTLDFDVFPCPDGNRLQYVRASTVDGGDCLDYSAKWTAPIKPGARPCSY